MKIAGHLELRLAFSCLVLQCGILEVVYSSEQRNYPMEIEAQGEGV